MASSPTVGKPIRSPSYPSSSLNEAIAHVRKIEGLYRLGPVDRVAGAKLIGYSGLSGPANQALASLAQFGLVERAGKGEMRVTERARAILHPNSEEEKREGLRIAAFEPQLFRELHERWPNMIPPEEGVVTYLNRQGFNQSAIRPAAKAYRQTLLFLEEVGANESHGLGDMSDPDSVFDQAPEATHMTDAPRSPTPPITALMTTALPVGFANVAPSLNKINMNVKGSQVYLEALLDRKGIASLKRKLASLEVLLDEDEGLPDNDDMLG